MTNISQPIYCGSGVDNFHTSYKNWHGYISLMVCLLGTLANLLNIIVLSRREMRSPTNAILSGLAVADLAVMLEYIPYTVHDYILQLPREQQLTYGWACFIKFHSIFAQVLHTISIWLTVMLAVWRYIAVGYPQKNRIWCGMRTTMVTIVTAYCVCVLVVSPWLYLITSIAQFREELDEAGKTVKSMALSQYVVDYEEFQKRLMTHAVQGIANDSSTTAAIWHSSSTMLELTESPLATPPPRPTISSPPAFRNVIVYRLYYSSLALYNIPLRNATFLIYSVLIKLIPCIALTILSVRLIAALLEAKRRRKQLTCNAAANGMKSVANGRAAERTRKNSRTLEKEKQTDRTTRMLLAVLMLFLITEFPQGIMGLLNTILGDAFYTQCYLKMSDLVDILALLNSSINFILYCSMSRQFRSTFALLFRPKFLDRWLPVVTHDDDDDDGVAAVAPSEGRTDNGNARFGARELNCPTTQVTNV